jgi:hypothetical protein
MKLLLECRVEKLRFWFGGTGGRWRMYLYQSAYLLGTGHAACI